MSFRRWRLGEEVLIKGGGGTIYTIVKKSLERSQTICTSRLISYVTKNNHVVIVSQGQKHKEHERFHIIIRATLRVIRLLRKK